MENHCICGMPMSYCYAYPCPDSLSRFAACIPSGSHGGLWSTAERLLQEAAMRAAEREDERILRMAEVFAAARRDEIPPKTFWGVVKDLLGGFWL